MARLQGDHDRSPTPRHPGHQIPQAPPDSSEVPLAFQCPPSNVPPALGCLPQGQEKPAQFSYQPPGAAVVTPPSQVQHQAVPFPPIAPPCTPSDTPPADYRPRSPLIHTDFSCQPPGAAVNYPPKIPQPPVSFPPNIVRPYDVHQAAAFKPQPVNNPPADGQHCHQPQYGPVLFGGYGIGTAPWTTGLFDCMDDPTNTLITCFLPCVTFGQVAEILDNGMTSCLTSGLLYGALAWLGVPCILSCTYRATLRAKYDLLESPAPDLFTHLLCMWCSLCQEYRELKNRGLHPGIGWQGNLMLQAQRQQVGMTPPRHQTMAAP